MSTVGSDTFADATELGYGATSDPTPSSGLTTEAGEPDNWGNGTGANLRSAWWKFTAPATETVGLDLLSSTVTGDLNNTDPFISVWTGNDLASLVSVADGDDNSRMEDATTHHRQFPWLTEMNFDATEGVTYYIQVGLYTSSDNMEYVLRLGKRVITTSDWIQDSNITTTYDLDDSSKWYTHNTLAWTDATSGTVSSAGAIQGTLDTDLQANLSAVEAATDLDSRSPQGYMTANAGSIQDGSNYNISTYTGARMEAFRPYANPVSQFIDATPDLTSQDPEFEGTSELISFTLDSYDITWRTYMAWADQGPGHNSNPDISSTIELGFLNPTSDTIDPGDITTWDLSDRTTLDTWTFAANGDQQSGTDYDLTGAVLPFSSAGGFVLVQMPTALGSVPTWVTPTTDNTVLFASAENKGTTGGFATTLGFSAVGDTRTVTYVVRPARYRYVYWDIAPASPVHNVPERIYPESIEPSRDPSKTVLVTNIDTDEVEWGTVSGGGGGGGGESTWTAPTFENSWADFGAGFQPTGFRKDSDGIVHIRGVVSGGTVGSTVFTLPAGYIPPNNCWFPVVSSNSDGSSFDQGGVAFIGSDGEVIIQLGHNSFISLDGILFYTD